MDWITAPTIWEVLKNGRAVSSANTQEEARKTLAKHIAWDAAAEANKEKVAAYAAIKLQAETQQREERYASGIMDGSVFATKETRPANDSFYLEDEERH